MAFNGKLALNALVKYSLGLFFVSLLLFLPAGSIEYAGAWLFIALLFVPMLIMGVAVFILSPQLLERRLKSKESRGTQKGVVALSGVIFLVGFVVAGLDFRFGWSAVQPSVRIAASLLFLLSYTLYGEVMRENEWLSRTIGVSKGQKVVSTGLYGIVRHPMYFATILLFLSIPLILGSWWSFAAFLLYIPAIVVRTLDEERQLLQELDGYKEYCSRIRWRILPFVW
ncbi:MAG: isoprenylcysteine carboxylmethyltransferase family protein [Bacteroidaceae bacterium]|nr:isoprenylcysteine carboxylmethyltransferase family protein [Bacteroidaceae bacterium]